MLAWLKGLFAKKVDTSPAVPEAEEPSIGDVVVSLCLEEEARLHVKAQASESQAYRVKLNAQAEAIRNLRLRVQSLMEG